MLQVQRFVQIEIAFGKMRGGPFHHVARRSQSHARFLDHEVEREKILPVEIGVEEQARTATLNEQFPGVPRRTLAQAGENVKLQLESSGKDGQHVEIAIPADADGQSGRERTL